MGIEEILASNPQLAGLGVLFAGAMIVLLVVYLIVLLAMYIYCGLTLMGVARRTKTEPAWLAWVPIGNLYLMSKIAKMPWWPMLLMLGFWIPFLNIALMITFAVFMFIWLWKICEAMGKPGWWALLTLIPGFGSIWYLVMWGILAWGKD